jgi:pimeloyl-ACP methyl ester carboxylesterase
MAESERPDVPESAPHRSFPSFDGVRIAYYKWGDHSALPPVVLHHGFVANTRVNWEVPGVVAALTAAGRQVYSLDARGHGASGKPHDAASYGEGAMSRDLRAFFDLIGAPRVHLVGYSMGSLVSLLTAATDRRVSRLVVGGVGGSVAELGGPDSRVVRRDAIAAALLADDPATITDRAARGFRRFADAVGADRFALAAHSAAVHQVGLPLADITAPTLVLAGASDPVAARPHVLADAIPHGQALVIPGDHFSAVTDPAFAPAIVEFLASSP